MEVQVGAQEDERPEHHTRTADRIGISALRCAFDALKGEYGDMFEKGIVGEIELEGERYAHDVVDERTVTAELGRFIRPSDG
jgi:hypothetical protein